MFIQILLNNRTRRVLTQRLGPDHADSCSGYAQPASCGDEEVFEAMGVDRFHNGAVLPVPARTHLATVASDFDLDLMLDSNGLARHRIPAMPARTGRTPDTVTEEQRRELWNLFNAVGHVW
jgi:hypothetical protein